MSQRRPAHKAAHSPCPNGAANWVDCDYKYDWRFGNCKAMIEDKKAGEPRECSNRALDGDQRWCGQHYASKIESERKAKRIAIAREAMDSRADAFIEFTREHPSIHDRMAAGGGLEPPTSRVTADRSTSELPRKGPHRLTELA